MLGLLARAVWWAQADLAQLPQILLAVSDAQLAAMQRALATVWHRFMWSSIPIFSDIIQDAYSNNRNAPGNVSEALLAPRAFRDPAEDDAFATIMQWLAAKL